MPKSSLPAADKTSPNAEASWSALCDAQGWNELSKIIHLEGFIRSNGLFARFAAYAEAAAEEENAG